MHTCDQSTVALPVVVDRRRSMRLHGPLVLRCKARIAGRRLAPGARVPSTRNAARRLGVSRTAVASAYE
jgi:GntR family transcriptional regulator/MocR family aminotransferase